MKALSIILLLLSFQSSFSQIIPIDLIGCFGSPDCRPRKVKVELKPSKISRETLFEKGYQLKSEISCKPNFNEIKKLAQVLELTNVSKYNPELIFDVGDFTYWASENLFFDDLIYEFVLLKNALEALEEIEFTLKRKNKKDNLKGIWSSISENMKKNDVVDDEWQALIKKYSVCKDRPIDICFPLDTNLLICVMKWRIDTMNNKLNRSPFLKKISENDMERCAKYYGLPPEERYNCRPSLKFLTGDLTHFFEKYKGNPILINKELASRKILLDAADLDNSPCIEFKTKGDLSDAVERYIIPKLYISKN